MPIRGPIVTAKPKEVYGPLTGKFGGADEPDNAVVNRDGAFVLNRDGAYVVADPTPRTS